MSCPGWPILLALTGVPALIQLLSLPFFPESPRYTLIEKGDEETARQGTGTQVAHPQPPMYKTAWIGQVPSGETAIGVRVTGVESRELALGGQCDPGEAWVLEKGLAEMQQKQRVSVACHLSALQL